MCVLSLKYAFRAKNQDSALSKGLSQQELAEKINKTRPLISHIEQTGHVNAYTLAAISEVLGVSLDEIENIINEPDSRSLTDNEIKRMQDEIALLKTLVESQEQTILLLKEKLVKKKLGKNVEKCSLFIIINFE